jgi:hypothetical protein
MDLDWKIVVCIMVLLILILLYIYFSQQNIENPQDITRSPPKLPPPVVPLPMPASSLSVETKVDITDDQLAHVRLFVSGGTPPYRFFVERSPLEAWYTFLAPNDYSTDKHIATHSNIPDGVYQYRIKDDQSDIIYTPRIVISRSGDIRTYRLDPA